jgi:hypothetical protein
MAAFEKIINAQHTGQLAGLIGRQICAASALCTRAHSGVKRRGPIPCP